MPIKYPLGLLFLISQISLAQPPSNPKPSSDLSSPSLAMHGRLPRYFRSGPPIAEELAAARAGAAPKNIQWKGLRFLVHDADSLKDITNSGAEAIYEKLSCNADLVVLGKVMANTSHLSFWGTVYTDYLFHVESIWRAKPLNTNPPSLNQQIIITKPGGALLVNGDPVSFEFEGFPELKPGITYIQFVKLIPESLAYQSINEYSTLEANGEDWSLIRGSSRIKIPRLNQDGIRVSVSNWTKSCKD